MLKLPSAAMTTTVSIMDDNKQPPALLETGQTGILSLRLLGLEIFSRNLLLTDSESQEILSIKDKNISELEETVNKLKAELKSQMIKQQNTSRKSKKTQQNLDNSEKQKVLLNKQNNQMVQENRTLSSRNESLNRQHQSLGKTVRLRDTKIVELDTRMKNLIDKNTQLAIESKDAQNQAALKTEAAISKLETQKQYLLEIFNQRNSPAAMQLLQKRIGAPLGLETVHKSETLLPETCRAASIQYHQQSVATMKVSATILAKENQPASLSQDACSFGEIDGVLKFAVADGVSTSSRQSEWAQRLVRACVTTDEELKDRFTLAQQRHEIDGPNLGKLVDPPSAWAWETQLEQASHATLLIGTLSPNGTLHMRRQGDTWAAVKSGEEKEWQIVFNPSPVNGTKAITSQAPLTFEESSDITDVSKVMVMTDGVASSNTAFLDKLWKCISSDNAGALEDFVVNGRKTGDFENDDVTVVAMKREANHHK